MAVMTGYNGALRDNGATVCRIRNWNLNITRDALDVTCLGQEWRDYVTGLKGATGSATLIYDPQESAAVALLNGIFTRGGDGGANVEFVLSTGDSKRLSAKAYVTSTSPSVSVGEVTTIDVQFQVNGAITGTF